MSYHMKGRTPTAQEKAYQDKVAEFGCYCCQKMGHFNSHILLHHTRGRVIPEAHMKIIPLCSSHHDYHVPGGLHHGIGPWRKKWGREEDIVEELQTWVETQR